jgi:hypothetical protein
MIDPAGPVILYDPARGTGEYFIAEYRTPVSPNGPGYDANVADAGVALWHVQLNSQHHPILVHRVEYGTDPVQNLWRWCKKCQGLHYISNGDHPVFHACPAGDLHSADDSIAYLPVFNAPTASGQHGWRWCSKCFGMFFGPGQSASHCPLGGTHDGGGSGDYAFTLNDPAVAGQSQWRWCQKCQGLFYGPNQGTSHCPAGGAHDGSASGNYTLHLEGDNYTVWNESNQTFDRGVSTFYHSDEYSPYLRWADGSSATAYLHVKPFSRGDGSVRLEWIAYGDTWVDFNTWPFLQLGTFDWPWATASLGVAMVPYGGTLHFKTGSSSGSLNISKKMEIRAYNGPVTIGR